MTLRYLWFGVFAIGVAISVSMPLVASTDAPDFVVRFDDYQSGSVEEWLKAKGFVLEQDAKRRDRIELDVGPRGLEISAKRKSLGLMPNDGVNLHEFRFIEVDWGVEKHPTGASYEQGVRNEAIMLVVFMGDERTPSGSMFIPDAPYFVGMFLCSGDDRTGHPYIGSYFKKGGRYVCVDRPDSGVAVTSRYDLLAAYRSFFDKENDDDPGISGIALALDTKKARDNGASAAFIKQIRFYR